MEKHIQKKIIDYLKSIGAYVIKTVVANRNGVPDIVACYQGSFIGIEVKAERNKPTKLQEWNLKQIHTAGGISFVARSVEEVKRQIDLIFA